MQTHDEKAPATSEQERSKAQFLFEIFCATLFLSMIGLVFYNAILRKVFNSSYPPSEEWARFLFIYITFFGAIEGFYRYRHIAVDMFVNLLGPGVRKIVDILAMCLGISAMTLLLYGGIVNVLQTMDTYSPATGVNLGIINGTLPIMAFAALLLQLRDLKRRIMPQ
ncbi:MAG: TRAP transporter small permease [Desulfovibrionaceae bacterium]|nr:TRAP transporter small permease [Desulfovibrionaceae bacterium]